VRADEQRGAASVEHAGLALLVSLLLTAAIAAAASGPLDGGRELGSALARKLRCAARAPDPCWRDPLTEAYGRSLAGAVRAFAPLPEALVGPGSGALLPVDFRYCRRPSCAAPGPRSPLLTASNRRTTAYVSVEDDRRSSGEVTISYWFYRPSLGWQRLRRSAGSAGVSAHAATPLLESAVPVLVPLETLPGRNHYEFGPEEEPPWRWRVKGRYP
jgi:Flp pilus assembly pilin Flp